ncbi:hypothetical protein I5M34_24355 [Pseudomonas aeruginosa]|nr:hypothetical protein [Pseudomonas aeruginosa]
MAKNIEFIVIDGCIQEGKKVYLPGEPYSPPSTQLSEEFLKSGVIAPVKDPAAQALLRASQHDLPAKESTEVEKDPRSDLLGPSGED